MTKILSKSNEEYVLQGRKHPRSRRSSHYEGKDMKMFLVCQLCGEAFDADNWMDAIVHEFQRCSLTATYMFLPESEAL